MPPPTPPSLQRRWLAAKMVGAEAPSIDADAQADTLLACAIAEGMPSARSGFAGNA